jgi:hypothetical protein
VDIMKNKISFIQTLFDDYKKRTEQRQDIEIL